MIVSALIGRVWSVVRTAPDMVLAHRPNRRDGEIPLAISQWLANILIRGSLGAYGKDEIALKPIPIPSQTPVGAKILAAVLFAGLLVLSPVTIPASTYAAVRHKRRKGEWR